MLNESQRSQLEKVLLGERERLLQAAKDGLKFSMERERSIGRDSIDECEDCGETISFRRLMARPVTTLCIDCKEEKEKEELTKSQTIGRGGGGGDESMSDHMDDE